MLGLWWAAGHAAGLGAPYYALAAAAAAHSLWGVRTADFGDVPGLARRFRGSVAVGWLMLAGILAGRVFKGDEGGAEARAALQ